MNTNIKSLIIFLISWSSFSSFLYSQNTNDSIIFDFKSLFTNKVSFKSAAYYKDIIYIKGNRGKHYNKYPTYFPSPKEYLRIYNGNSLVLTIDSCKIRSVEFTYPSRNENNKLLCSKGRFIGNRWFGTADTLVLENISATSVDVKSIKIIYEIIHPTYIAHISKVCVATLFDEKNLYIPRGIRAFTLVRNKNELFYSKEYEPHVTLPSHDAVLLKADEEGDYPFIISHHDPRGLFRDTKNVLKGTKSDSTLITNNGTYYILSLNKFNDFSSVGFYKSENDGKILHNKNHHAYLFLNNNSRISKLMINETTLSIPKIELYDTQSKFNLQGGKINKLNGIVIQNGKKYIYKNR